MEQVLLEHISGHAKEQKAIKNSQQGFTTGKPCLTNLTTFYNKMTRLVNKGRTADSIYFLFSKSFNKSVVSKLQCNTLDGWIG